MIAVRDVVVLLVIAFAFCFALQAWATHVTELDWWRRNVAQMAETNQRLLTLGVTPTLIPPPNAPPLAWDYVARTTAGWVTGLSLWVAACWVATRARAGQRTVVVPGILATAVVVVRSVAALVREVPGGFFSYAELWPGPTNPTTPEAAGPLTTLLAYESGSAYPPLVIGLLLAASLLGARAGRRPADRASRRIMPTALGGRVTAAVVVGLPAVGGAAAAVVGYVFGTRTAALTTSHSIALELVAPLALAVLAAALLSGTGPLGGAVTVLASAPVVVGPVLTWAALQAGELAIVETAGAALLCAAVALWRPCCAWAAEVLAPAHRPPAEPPPWARAATPVPPSGTPDAL